MDKSKILTILGLAFFILFSLNQVSAYYYATTTFPVSDSITYSEDISGADRGFTLRRSAQVSRLTPEGYYDWSYMPSTVIYPNPSEYKISDRLATQAFRTFQQDSQTQLKIQLEKQRRKSSYRHWGYYGTFRYSW